MNSTEIFTVALQLENPWYVKEVTFKDSELHIVIDFERGGLFKNSLGTYQKAYDTSERSWQHLNFFQHKCFIHARVPRVLDVEDKVRQVDVPWARKGSGFTLLFEAYSMLLIESEMPVSKASAIVGVYAQRLWNVFNYWIEKSYKEDEQSGIVHLGIDETSTKKGHNYVTLGVDLDSKRVIKATPGKGSECISEIANHLESKGSPKNQVKQICIDMSPSFISGCTKEFENAAITFDKFHVIKEVNKAMDEVRKLERREFEILKGHKYVFLKNDKSLTYKQKQSKWKLMQELPSMAEAYRLKELFSIFWDLKDPEEATAYLSYWCDIVQSSAIQPFIKAANTIKAHWSGIVNYIKSRINNGILEGINSKVQLAKKRARGYRNINNFINMIYFTCAKLKFDYPQYSI